MANGIMETGSIRESLQWGPGTHPLDQAHYYTPFPLYPWQIDLLNAGARPKSRVIESDCNKSGKTSVIIPVFGFSCMMAFPGCQVLSTSGDSRQVKEQLFEQQLRPLVMQESWQLAGWKINISDASMKVRAPNGSTWLGYVTGRDTTFEGFHGYKRPDEKTGKQRYCPLIFLVDEAKSTSDSVHDSIRRIDPDFWITLSTPGTASGWFYDGVGPDTLKAPKKDSHNDCDAAI